MANVYTYLRHKSHKPPTPDPVITKFRNRIFAEDNDVFVILAGKRGSTKTGCAMSLGYQIDINRQGDTRFYLDEKYFPKNFQLLAWERLPRVIYKPSHLLDMLKHNEKYPMGTCIVWDEVGVEGDAREFAKKKNKLLKRTFQTIRSLNWFLELTAVTIKDFDVAFGRNAGFYIRTESKTKIFDGEKQYPYGRTKIYEIDVNPTTAKTFYKFLQYNDVDGKDKILSGGYYIRKPPAFLENPCKRYKNLFQTRLYSEYANELDNIDEFQLDETAGRELDIVNDKLREILANPEDYYNYKKRRFVLAAIQFLGDIKIESEVRARKILQLLNLKASRGEIYLKKA